LRTGKRVSAPSGAISSFRREYTLKVSNQRFQRGRPGAQAHKQILRGKCNLLAPEPFAYQTPGSIAIYGTPKNTLGYDQA
jgi:hypothetical protein